MKEIEVNVLSHRLASKRIEAHLTEYEIVVTAVKIIIFKWTF